MGRGGGAVGSAGAAEGALLEQGRMKTFELTNELIRTKYESDSPPLLPSTSLPPLLLPVAAAFTASGGGGKRRSPTAMTGVALPAAPLAALAVLALLRGTGGSGFNAVPLPPALPSVAALPFDRVLYGGGAFPSSGPSRKAANPPLLSSSAGRAAVVRATRSGSPR